MRVDELTHLWHSANASPTGLEGDEERQEHHQREARHIFNDIGRILLPWYKQWEEEGQTIAEMWKQFKLREKDPKYAAFLANERAKLRGLGEAARARGEAEAKVREAMKKRHQEQDLRRRRKQNAGLRRGT